MEEAAGSAEGAEGRGNLINGADRVSLFCAGRIMRLNYYLPGYDFSETHNIVIQSTLEKIFRAVVDIDLKGSRVMKILFGIRGFYARLNPWRKQGDLSHPGLNLQELINKNGFIFLDAINNQEIILGVIGKFWQPSGGIIKNFKADKLMISAGRVFAKQQ